MADSNDQEPTFQDRGRMNEDGNPVEDGNDVTSQQLEEHEQLWRQLLMQIWQGESADRIPLAYLNGFILRSGTISNLDEEDAVTSSNTVLDWVAKRMVVWMEEEGELATQL